MRGGRASAAVDPDEEEVVMVRLAAVLLAVGVVISLLGTRWSGRRVLVPVRAADDVTPPR